MSDEYVDDEDMEAILNEAQTAGDEVPVDLSEADEFEPLPEGQGSGPEGMYLLLVKNSNAGPGVTTRDGVPAWKLKFQVIDPQASRKAVVARTMPLQGPGAAYVRETAKALGIPLGDPPRLRAPKYIGTRAWAVLEISELNPNFNNVGRMKEYEGAAHSEPLIGDDDE